MQDLLHLKGIFKDELFESQMNRLKGMHRQAVQHDSSPHADFLDKVTTQGLLDHLYRMEHHGEQYWKGFGAEAEERRAILEDRSFGVHDYGNGEEQQRFVTTMLSPRANEPRLPESVNDLIENNEGQKAHRLWLAHQQLGQLALLRKDYAAAERSFRLALREAQGWAERVELAETMSLLTQALERQGKTQAVQVLYNLHWS